MNAKQIKAEAHALIDLATLLAPEAEGIDLEDKEYTPEQMAMLKDKLSHMRRAIDLVNKGLAQEWMRQDPDGDQRVEVDNLTYYLGYNSGWVFQDGMSLPFAKWLKKQTAENIEAIVPDRSLRLTPMGDAKDTFLRKRRTSESVTIKNTKPKF